MRTFGIMQGRLSPKEASNLQSFPIEFWEHEFERASAVGFKRIEWLIDERDPATNPVMSKAGRGRLRTLSQNTAVSVDTLCLHHFIGGQLTDPDASVRRDASNLLTAILECADEAGIATAVLPAMEGACLKDGDARDRFAEQVGSVMDSAGVSCGVAIESDLPASEQAYIISQTNPALGVCFDVGNLTAAGLDLPSSFEALQDNVVEVHIKDRVLNGGSRLLGEGDVDFAQVRQILDQADYSGPIVLETPVLDDWEASAKHNINYIAVALSGGQP